MSDSARFACAMQAIDAANRQDPISVAVDGERRPKELVHAERMSEWVERLAGDPDELQRLAARAHHIRRWEVARSSYPEGRSGYLRWRTELARHHAALVGDILTECGYEEAEVARVQTIIQKKGLVSDPDVQVHEDARCLVFLEMQLVEMVDRLGEERMTGVLVKTLAKMSRRGVAAAATLELPERERHLLEAARSQS